MAQVQKGDKIEMFLLSAPAFGLATRKEFYIQATKKTSIKPTDFIYSYIESEIEFPSIYRIA